MSEAEETSTRIRPPERNSAPSPSAGLEASVRFTPGTVLSGRYRLVAPLGKGGMGEVYRADDIRLGQPVALKFLPAAFAADSARLQLLVDEVRIGRQISHPNVCRLYDIAEADGHHFLVMEYVDGEDLASLLRRIGRLSGAKALEIARGTCAGLAAAHDKGVIHRDLKPGNVMIDGRGHARIADFGLAALSHDPASAQMSGTPQYMAPEQLLGGGASLRSDVFALGLVMHEMLTGQRLFDAKSLDELRALHRDTRPLSLSSSATDVDPGLDRVVQRCLSKDIEHRPANAREVLLSLPGGDPLQAAILAGETPSPEMVAAAGRVGDLKASHAWLILLAGLAGLWAVPALTARVGLWNIAPMPKSPEVLAERAREISRLIGHEARTADSASGYFTDLDLVDHIERGDETLARRQTLRAIKPSVFRFSYRESPAPLISNSWFATLPWQGPPTLGRTGRTQPALTTPGMMETVVDMDGRLTEFTAIPPRFEKGEGPWPEPDWTIALREAGLDPSACRESTPRWTPPTGSDRQRAWDSVYAGQPDVPIHVEAASYHGRPTYVTIQGPWVEQTAAEDYVTAFGSTALTLALGASFLSTVPLVIGGIVLVRRNLRMGRGDRRGAFRLALVSFFLLSLAQAFGANHTSVARWEYALIIQIVSQASYAALAVWSLYMALEPAVRRRWPHMLISWSRLLQGRWSDPLVSSGVLIGLVLGLVMTVNPLLGVEIHTWFGAADEMWSSSVLSALSSSRQVAYYLLIGPCMGIVMSLALLMILYLLQAVFRRAWVAQVVVCIFAGLPALAGGQDAVRAVVATIFGIIVVLTVTRLGLLSTAVMLATFVVVLRAPLTLDPSDWYFGRSLAVLVLFAGLLIGSAWLSLGGKPAFGKPLLDD